MDDKELKHLKDLLAARRKELLAVAQSSQEAAAVVELDQTRVGRLSRMDAMQQQAMAQAAENRRKAELRRTEVALERIDDEDYGRCRECDQAIALGRLRIDPTATRCVACAE